MSSFKRYDSEKTPPFSKKWSYGFRRRRSKLVLKTPTNLTLYRAIAQQRSNIEPFLYLLDGLIESKKFPIPSMWNSDETPITLHLPSKAKTFGTKDGPEHIRVIPPREKNATAMITIAADGGSTSTQVLWPRVTIPDEFKEKGVGVVNWIPLKGGWQTRDSFVAMMISSIIPQMVAKRELMKMPESEILLILDSHISRVSSLFLRACVQYLITILTLPAHTSHFLQV